MHVALGSTANEISFTNHHMHAAIVFKIAPSGLPAEPLLLIINQLTELPLLKSVSKR